MKKILFIHQNFPGQFKHLAPALVKQGYEVKAFRLKNDFPNNWQGVEIISYDLHRGNAKDIHPWLLSMESQTIRGEAVFEVASELKSQGYEPDLVIAHPGWGESLFIKEVWPDTRLGIYYEFYYRSAGYDVGFDPEFPVDDPKDVCRVNLKNLNIQNHFFIADGAITPTQFQASSFPKPFQSKLTITHEGIDTNQLLPNPDITLTLNNHIHLNRNNEIITFVNRDLEPARGYHCFIRSLPAVLSARPQAKVIIIGGDKFSYGKAHSSGKSWKDIYLEEVTKQHPEMDWQRVYFVGRVNYQVFKAIIQISTVHVYLTTPFFLSWSMLEAMSMGACVIGSDTAPVTEVLRHNENGWLVGFFDTQGLSHGILKLLGDSALRLRLSKNARQTIIDNYDLKTQCLPRQLEWVNKLLTL